MRFAASAFCAALLIAAASACQTVSVPNMIYPDTSKGDVADDYFGTKVPDPYRWMEDLESPEVANWVAAQNRVTFDYLDKLPMRARFKERITELWNYPKVDLPVREGGRYFYIRNSGLQRQAPLYMRASLRSEPSLVLDSECHLTRWHRLAAAMVAIARREVARLRAVRRRRRINRSQQKTYDKSRDEIIKDVKSLSLNNARIEMLVEQLYKINRTSCSSKAA